MQWATDHGYYDPLLTAAGIDAVAAANIQHILTQYDHTHHSLCLVRALTPLVESCDAFALVGKGIIRMPASIIMILLATGITQGAMVLLHFLWWYLSFNTNFKVSWILSFSHVA